MIRVLFECGEVLRRALAPLERIRLQQRYCGFNVAGMT
jgi:hypothetical protein